MCVQYISQEKLEVIRNFLESKDLGNIPRNITWLMWRAQKLYATEVSPQKYATDTQYDFEDLYVDLDTNGQINCLIVFNEWIGKSWIIEKK